MRQSLSLALHRNPGVHAAGLQAQVAQALDA
jgi:hypothetical protein